MTKAVEDALSSPADDEFAALPPSAPLGHEAEPKTSLIYPGLSQGHPNRQPVTWGRYVSASDAPLSDEAVHHRMFGDTTGDTAG